MSRKAMLERSRDVVVEIRGCKDSVLCDVDRDRRNECQCRKAGEALVELLEAYNRDKS